jgi:putative ABC transport system permease protein
MIGHYLRLALRTVPRAGPFVLISVVGLAIGFGAALLIALYVQDELGYERWLPNHDRIYMVSVRSPDGSMTDWGPTDIGLWMRSDFPQFETVTRLSLGGGFFARDDHEFTETITWADSNVFDVLRFPVVAGRLDGALDRPDTLVLTRRLAEKYFGRPDPIGETLVLDDEHPMTVTAVIDNLPSNTHLYVDVLGAGHSTYSPIARQDLRPLTIMASKAWGTRTYGLLKRGESVEPLRESIWTLPDRHSQRAPGGQAASEVWPVIVRSIGSIHLGARNVASPEAVDFSRLYGAIGIGVLIILAAAINFVTLRTALAMRRAVEVGVRKACGGSRRALFTQFMSEVLVHVCLATLLGVVLAAATLPALNAFLDRTIEWQQMFSAPVVGAALALLVAITLLAGSYPAFVLSSFRPSIVTKARATGRFQSGVRQVLVALQFAIVIAVLIATIVVHRQTEFGMREALRQASDPTVVLRTRCTDAIKDAMARVQGVKEVACAGTVPQLGGGTVGPVILPNSDERNVLGMVSVGYGFFELYGLRIIAGRAFAEDFGTDETPSDNVFTTPEAVVLNEAGVRRLGYASAEQAIGQDVTLNHPSGPLPTFSGEHPGRIIGVVEDFQIGSVRSEIYPTVFFADPWLFRVLNIKIEGRSTPETLDKIDALWAQMGDPGPPIRTFYEDSVQQLYGDLRRDFDMFSVFASVAILISALGLIGLAAHATVARTKEIGVRKVLGSGRAAIVRMLLWQFSLPVVLANLIAWPAAYLAMSRWLDGFARRIDLEPWMFVVAAAGTLAVAMATVLLHTWSIAGIRPVTALRHE